MSVETAHSAAVGRRRSADVAAPLAVAFTPFAVLVGLASAQGGFFPSSWGWASLPLLWLTAMVFALRQEIRLGAPERAVIALIVCVALWVLLSAAWSVAPARSILESQRALVYAAAVTAVLVLASSRHVATLAGGVLAAITAVCAFSLATRLFPDRVGVFDRTAVYRLAQPIGYWNGLAIFAALGALIAWGFAARARALSGRAAGAAVLVILLATFYYTFGRGAWVALAVGVVVALAVDPRRLQLVASLLAFAPAAAFGVFLASRASGLTHAGATLASATHDGHSLAVWLFLLAAANAGLAVAFALFERRFTPPPAARSAFAGVVCLVVAAALLVVFSRFGSPVTLVQKGYDAFRAPPPHAVADLNRRLLNFSGNGRAELWRLAWDDARAHPVLGAGAGTYERYFLAHQRREVSRVRDAHGLYVETLAEVGPIGLGLLGFALLLPLTMLGRVRRHPLVPALAGAYFAYLVHTGVDWDWELPAVTLVGLFCGALILLAARGTTKALPLGARLRWGGVAAAVVVSVGAAIGLVGNMELSRSASARNDGDWRAAATAAHAARSWMPWSPAPWTALGRAQRGAGALAEARRSFRKALSMDSGDWELWYDLATVTRGTARRQALSTAKTLFPRGPFGATDDESQS